MDLGLYLATSFRYPSKPSVSSTVRMVCKGSAVTAQPVVQLHGVLLDVHLLELSLQDAVVHLIRVLDSRHHLVGLRIRRPDEPIEREGPVFELDARASRELGHLLVASVDRLSATSAVCIIDCAIATSSCSAVAMACKKNQPRRSTLRLRYRARQLSTRRDV